ncbi:hypothetical protein [Pseudoalteromonas ulvae]|uniref:hypothetical protein n=1 Tax=Pseudoalteromonas ulvae TaxID=107327 RepID=UPI001120F922|nr:hypothetical protein [Pseudoalteromonas ulvae]
MKIGHPWPSFTLHFIHEMHDSSIGYFSGVITGGVGSGVNFGFLWLSCILWLFACVAATLRRDLFDV